MKSNVTVSAPAFKYLCISVVPQTGTVGVLSSEEKGTCLAGWVLAGLDGWHAALKLGACEWHAALELQGRGLGWVERSSEVGGAGGLLVCMDWGPRACGWNVALELGPRGFG